MKNILLLIIVFLSSMNSHAEYPNLSEEQMQQMMRQAKQMEACYSKVDQTALTALGERGKQMEQEMKSLCQAGKRDQAQEVAIKYGQEIANDETMQTVRKCGQMAQGMFDMAKSGFPTEKDLRDKHVCDGY